MDVVDIELGNPCVQAGAEEVHEVNQLEDEISSSRPLFRTTKFMSMQNAWSESYLAWGAIRGQFVEPDDISEKYGDAIKVFGQNLMGFLINQCHRITMLALRF